MRTKILFFAMFVALLTGVRAEDYLPKSADYLSAPTEVISYLKLVPDARVLYAGLPHPELLKKIYFHAPLARVDFSPDGGEYDGVLFFIAPESRPELSWASHLKQGGRGGIVAFPIFLQGPFPFPDYFRILEEMHMSRLDWVTRRFPCCYFDSTYKFRQWIEDSIIIPFGMIPSEELIDECIRLAAADKLVEYPQGEIVYFLNRFQVILFNRP